MSFPVDDILLGPATFGGLHRLDGIIWHTGEEPGFTRAYAVATANWQRTNPGSYNFRIYDRASDPRGVMLNVPYREASGGINPSSTAWAPGRFPFLERELGKAGKCPRAGCPGPYRNPTMHHLQASYVGRTAALNDGKAPANYLSDSLKLIAWAESHPDRGPAPLVHSKHGHWQTNRSDPGDWMFLRISPEQEDDILSRNWRPRVETWDTVPGGEFTTAGARKAFTEKVEVMTFLEEIEIVNGTVTTPMDRMLVANWPDPVKGPEVLFIPRGTLANPRNGRNGLLIGDAEALQAALDTANRRTADIKKAAASSMRKIASANNDVADGAIAAAAAIERL